jgi:nucleoside-triphosphatase THEP1
MTLRCITGPVGVGKSTVAVQAATLERETDLQG